MDSNGNGNVLLEVNNLHKWFNVRKSLLFDHKNVLKAVNGVSFKVNKGETLGIVGESGCGKTTLGRTILRLIEPTQGEIIFNGCNINTLDRKSLRRKRREMGIIFQDPFGSLNPRMKIGKVICEPLNIQHTYGVFGSRKKRVERVMEILDLVGLDRDYYWRYAHEFSGGQRQRIGIARALALSPQLLICDEPVSALDVSIQAQILNLMEDIQKKLGIAYVFISHDLSVVKHVSDNVAVMYLGKIVEIAPKDKLYSDAKHPYTNALISAIPIPDSRVKKKKILLQGDIPSPINLPPGCLFYERCYQRHDSCKDIAPELVEVTQGHYVACHKAN